MRNYLGRIFLGVWFYGDQETTQPETFVKVIDQQLATQNGMVVRSVVLRDG